MAERPIAWLRVQKIHWMLKKYAREENIGVNEEYEKYPAPYCM